MNDKFKARVVVDNAQRIGNKFGFMLFGSNIDTLLGMIQSDMAKRQKIWIATVNPEFVVETTKDNRFLKILQSKTSYNVIDGIGLIWGDKIKHQNSKIKKFLLGIKIGVEILGGRHRENLITGVDLMDKLCQMAEDKKQTVYFFGGWGDRSQKTAKYFLKKYPKLKVVGYGAEDFDFKTKVDYLFVARGMKKQEEWIESNFDKLNVGLVMGVGRSFDYYSGDLPRAPKWVQKIGLEWLFSLVMEPSRWRRQLALPKFIWKVLSY